MRLTAQTESMLRPYKPLIINEYLGTNIPRHTVKPVVLCFDTPPNSPLLIITNGGARPHLGSCPPLGN